MKMTPGQKAFLSMGKRLQTYLSHGIFYALTHGN